MAESNGSRIPCITKIGNMMPSATSQKCTYTGMQMDFPNKATRRRLHRQVQYRHITGSLQYLILTRPDLAHAVNMLSQSMHDPAPEHSILLTKILRYFKTTSNYGIPISKSNLRMRAFSDVDWAGDPSTRKSTSGFCTFLGNTLVSWSVKKQSTIARSSTESEYRALAAATANTIWLKHLLTDFSIHHDQPIELFYDNISASTIVNNWVLENGRKSWISGPESDL
ncbi:uncharacterized protein LOC110101524 [Dendrobium catenatum]|uniref:uncharacterized protein LOC110101524 n=1 Tax=Dendrobium catenatum TaxID=906689 RepID=UPI0009F68094|nr:uncharacterized protein LOC110101524 [Dendrobium catenatum]